MAMDVVSIERFLLLCQENKYGSIRSDIPPHVLRGFLGICPDLCERCLATWPKTDLSTALLVWTQGRTRFPEGSAWLTGEGNLGKEATPVKGIVYAGPECGPASDGSIATFGRRMLRTNRWTIVVGGAGRTGNGQHLDRLTKHGGICPKETSTNFSQAYIVHHRIYHKFGTLVSTTYPHLPININIFGRTGWYKPHSHSLVQEQHLSLSEEEVPELVHQVSQWPAVGHCCVYER